MAQPISSTAHDTLAQKSKDDSIVSGGRLVAKALKAEGVDTVFTLCGGHIMVTGVATAFRSESPILHIGGQSSLTQHKQGSLQDLPHVDMMGPITKFASGVFSTPKFRLSKRLFRLRVHIGRQRNLSATPMISRNSPIFW